MTRPSLAIAIALATLSSVPAQAADPPKTTTTTTVFGNDPCPKPRGDEIIVCAREPEGERYRIPKQFRTKPREESGGSASWASRVAGLEDAQRFTRPNSCTAIGSNGQTGCTQAMIRQWFLERHMAKDLLP
ncbi:hypothetical protein [Sphingomonas sp. SUN039]|uniref:hypothetical protein n=1 Tax=Sphingomonas sp. SUN039 TaxID=2937787 RepID=UPI002164B328|nr:hypothetical protein [Sphingomonas sp. SUN039]UVO54565.1 hypothetical protein M0209_10690 [Sphingomonas sp. SUN039]